MVNCGELSLSLDGKLVAKAKSKGPLASQPADGLDVSSDEGAAVGPYPTPNKFTGRIDRITIQTSPK